LASHSWASSRGGPGGRWSTSVCDNVNKFILSTRQILNRFDLPWMHAKLVASSLGGLRQGTGSRTHLETSRAATKAATSDLREPFCLPASLAVGSTLTAMSQRNEATS